MILQRHNSFDEAKNFSQFWKLFLLDQLSDEFLGLNKNVSIQNDDVEFLGQKKNLILIQNYHVEFLGQNKNFLIQNYDVG